MHESPVPSRSVSLACSLIFPPRSVAGRRPNALYLRDLPVTPAVRWTDGSEAYLWRLNGTSTLHGRVITVEVPLCRDDLINTFMRPGCLVARDIHGDFSQAFSIQEAGSTQGHIGTHQYDCNGRLHSQSYFCSAFGLASHEYIHSRTFASPVKIETVSVNRGSVQSNEYCTPQIHEHEHL